MRTRANAHAPINRHWEILSDHALSIEKRSVQGNRVSHDFHKVFADLVETGHDFLFQLSIEICRVMSISGSGRPLDRKLTVRSRLLDKPTTAQADKASWMGGR